MIVKHLVPSKMLQPYIESYWCWESENNDADVYLPRIPPNIENEVVIYYRAPFVVFRNGQKVGKMSQSHLVGLSSGFLDIEPSQPAEIGFISIRFRPGALRHFCNCAISETAHSFPTLEQIWGKDGVELTERVFESRSLHERYRVIDRWLQKMLCTFYKEDKLLDYIIAQVMTAKGTKGLQVASESMNVSYRQFQRYFKQAIGLQPKLFQRISRFQHVLTQIYLNDTAQYLPIILENGYYDQSHFIKDCHEFLHEKPSALLQQTDYLSYFYNAKHPRYDNLFLKDKLSEG